MLADRPRAVALLTKIFLTEIERLLLTASGGAPDAETPGASRPRLGGISPATASAQRSTIMSTCTPESPTASSCRLLATQGVTHRRRSCRPGRGRKATRPRANGVVELTPFEFLDRLADLVPMPRKHRHRCHGVFAPNHKLRKAVTALAVGNIGKRCDAAAGGHGGVGHATGGCCDTHQKPRSHVTSRIAWAKLLARVGEEFPLECPNCGGDIRLIAFITQPGPIRKILTHLGEPLESPPISPARGPPTALGELVQAHDDREAVQASPDELPAIDIDSL
jgi:hypothetical protein